MSYKNKYLKYKLKYLNLKKKLRGGGSETDKVEEKIAAAEEGAAAEVAAEVEELPSPLKLSSNVYVPSYKDESPTPFESPGPVSKGPYHGEDDRPASEIAEEESSS